MLSEVFWIAFIGTCSGLVIKIASMAYKSKCSECDCLGFHIKRNVELEEKETEFLQLNKVKSSEGNTNLDNI